MIKLQNLSLFQQIFFDKFQRIGNNKDEQLLTSKELMVILNTSVIKEFI